MKPLKILFVMRTGAHFPYHVTTINHLRRRGHDVLLRFDPTWHSQGPIAHRALDEWLSRAGQPDVGEALTRSGRWKRILKVTREARSYASYCRREGAVEFYRTRWRHYLPLWLRRFAVTQPGALLFRRALTGRFLTAIERLAPADPGIVAALESAAPACVVASPTNLRFDEEIEYIKAARSLGIPSVVPVLSWDNLTTKGLLHVQPDLVLAWHKGHVREAREIHGISAGRIFATGAPFFDKWFDRSRPISSRAATCQLLGLDPARPYLLYLGSSGNIAQNESWLVIELLKALRELRSPGLRRLQVVFKPHPANLRPIPRLDRRRVAIWPREHGLPDTGDTIGQFRDMLHHATAVLGINTTGMVDAVLCDRPCIALMVDQYKTTQADAVHFQRMVQSKALYVADSVKQAVQIVGKLAAGQDSRTEARQKFMQLYARPHGLGAAAGEAAAVAIEHVASRRPIADLAKVVEREFAGRRTPEPLRTEQEPGKLPSRTIQRTIDKARRNAVFRHYERVREHVLRMMDDAKDPASSDYWKQELRGFEYMFDASPLVIAKLREHTFHLTGLKSYDYRHHHAARAAPFACKLRELQQLDTGNLFVPEAPHLGGFGHRLDDALVNLDTLKFYESLIALDQAGIVSQLRINGTRNRVLEIGAGWGGFAYQFKTLFPATTYLIIDLPPTILFSATYLGATFPDAKMRFYGEEPTENLLKRDEKVDFIFIPAHALRRMTIPAVDLAVNVASFQEMTTVQVTDYVRTLDEAGCRHLYSHNRDRSPYNNQLSSVSEILESAFRVEAVDVLPVPYTVLTTKQLKKFERESRGRRLAYRHLIGHRRRA